MSAPFRRADILAEARAWLGTPYRHRASVKGEGADCLGLVRGVWRALLGPEPEPLPPYAPDWAEAGKRETLADTAFRRLVAVPLDEARPGDVLLFRFRPHLPAKHAALLSAGAVGGGGMMIHAYDGAAVCESHLGRWWSRRCAFAFAFPGVAD
ncbi:NlpC/P60 family protein [Xanthobacter tagetidis]|uniref:Peptidase P60 n=1 Tax=Xanthobacter tagetidis TaxID=60216 RepID=A0A3L6ZWL6_9HYPH|nr:NlpC/P60 family protein [Xanthobacter tagetidis]MBB6307027.1 NlpC/P60 family putative phage cell wall peptidase [Xanthobacter tagetidis]RLP72269.1 peptidase P60 [Xanthobacter tagetidis]